MNEHATPLTLSERADQLEEQMMHELGERIATRSTLFNIADGKVEMPNGPALKGGHSEKVVLACLLHDIGVASFIRADHGYWGAQMIEPYVDREVSWAVRTHQALRFFPDPSVGYEYPEMYIKYFGADYKPEPYIVREYERARNHKYYM